MAPVVTDMTEAVSSDNMVIGDNALLAQAFANTSAVTNSMGIRLAKVGADDARNPKKMDPVAALATAWQLVLEQKLGEGSAFRQNREGVETICPWTDITNALAVLDGGNPMYFALEDPVLDGSTMGWAIRRDEQ